MTEEDRLVHLRAIVVLETPAVPRLATAAILVAVGLRR